MKTALRLNCHTNSFHSHKRPDVQISDRNNFINIFDSLRILVKILCCWLLWLYNNLSNFIFYVALFILIQIIETWYLIAEATTAILVLDKFPVGFRLEVHLMQVQIQSWLGGLRCHGQQNELFIFITTVDVCGRESTGCLQLVKCLYYHYHGVPLTCGAFEMWCHWQVVPVANKSWKF